MARRHFSPFLLVVACLLTLSIPMLRGNAMPNSPLQSHPGSSSGKCRQDFELKEADCSILGLDSVPQDLSEDIVRLDLYVNKFVSLLNSSFERYPLINHLDISNNDIRMIESAAFHPLKELIFLSLNFNRNLLLPDTGLFKWSRKLSSLNLVSTNLTRLPNDTLKWISHSDELLLGQNQLSFINISSCGTVRNAVLIFNQFKHIVANTFNFACHTDTLFLTGNPIRSVDPSVIASLHVGTLILADMDLEFEVLQNIFVGISRSKIQELHIAFSSLKKIPKGFFDPLHNHYISVLDFSYNKIGDLYYYAFSNLTYVKQLNLDGNLIDVIEPGFFEGTQELRVLQVNDNRLQYINPHNRTWTLDLVELHLSHNLLTKISQFAFVGLENLTLLDLSSNEDLAVFEVTSFSGLDSIKTIDLSECNIEWWILDTPSLQSLSLNDMNMMWFPLNPGKSFKRSQCLVHLNMSDVGLRIPNLWNARSKVSLFDGLFHLKTLDLSKNPSLSVDELPLGIFRQLSALQELNLDNCYLSMIHPLLFAKLESLQKLTLKGNMIKQLHCDVLMGLGNLTSIDLEGNFLTYLDKTIFSNNRMLTNMSIANNKLTNLNESTFKPIFTSLLSLNLSMNPINCNCDLKWLLAWLSGPVHLINEKDTSCSSSSMDHVRGKLLLDFDVKILCKPNILSACLIPLGVVCLVVIVALMYYNRWQLRYKLFLLKLAAIGYKEMRDARDHNDYVFDLNIIFYDDDEEWIREHLRPVLGERLPQYERNVFGDKDLVWGMHYLDAVDYVVSHSYKTVIVLSRASVRDRWFMLKFRTAMDHVSDTQTEFVVVVFLEDIPDNEIPFLARLYLSDGRPYIYWTQNVRGHEYFWNELVKNLTINLRTNDLIPNE